MKWFNDITDGVISVTGLTDELESIYIDNIYNNKDSDLLVVTSTIYEANKIYDSLINYNDNVYMFQMDDFIASVSSISSPELEINRIETLNSIITNNNKKIVIVNLMGLLRFLPSKNIYKDTIITLKKDMEINKEQLYENLCNIGYKNDTLVTKTGEVSNRGYILDIFPIGLDNAIRIEFFGDLIESIRYFDVDTQLSINEIDEITIFPNSELSNTDNTSMLSEYLNNPIFIFKDYPKIIESYKLLTNEILEYKENNNISYEFMHNLEEIHKKNEIYILSVDSFLPDMKFDNTYTYSAHYIENYNNNYSKLNDDLSLYLNRGKTIIICLNSNQHIKNITEYINSKVYVTDINNIKTNAINIIVKKINNGFIFNDYIVLSEINIFKYSSNSTIYKSKFKIGSKINDTSSLKVGDYVVHNSHGIGMYLGIVALKKGDITKDYLQIKYKDDDKLYIPVEKIELISKYSTNEDLKPSLNKLGGTEWIKTKLRVKSKLKYIADELIRVAAERKMKKGFSFKNDDNMMKLFEDEFEYEETIDQINAIENIKKKMEDSIPMDMILCGDVGYGKTEVAFRAIFKAILSNKQVVYLCPTTILSNQQYKSALSRFKNFPVNIALVNRFTTKKDFDLIVSGLKNGSIDLVFGTHRLLNSSIEYQDLGMLVIDEEQRFGVVHKEKIKKYKSNIDVLTLSATPIPRTLQMSMVGIRDLTLIETPPKNRYPIQTYVLEENDKVIKDAIYKEISRNGQVYILCNRIETFDGRIKEITSLISDIKIGYAHGKMNKLEIDDIMNKFINKEYDVLLCTTIIETGIDIPNVNTIIILGAETFGLGQLYQIRGRVGRSDSIAYAYLMYSKNKLLSEIATKRLSAIKEFASLGSGLSIAKRDLSIRGAGDVLGSEQSGFIDSIGIELYLKMLNDEINRIKGIEVDEPIDELPLLNIGTHISDDYVKDDKLKIEIHKKINQINSYESLLKVKQEIEDRFGKINNELLIYMYEEWFESMKKDKGIESVNQNNKFIELVFNPEMTKKLKVDELFIKTYKISPNYRFSYSRDRLNVILNINNLDKHWIFYMIEFLLNI